MLWRYRGFVDGTYRGAPPRARGAPPSPRRTGAGPNVVQVVGEIGEASAARIIAQIEAAPPGPLEILVNSNGGNFGHALKIGAAIQRHKSGKSTGYALKVESAAVIVMAACGRVVMARDGSIYVQDASFHDPDGVTLNSMDETAHSLRRAQRVIADICADRSKSTPSSFWTMLMNANNGQGTRLSAEDCINYGLADSVSPWPKSHLLRGQR